MTYRGLVIGRQDSPTQKSNGAAVAEIGVMWSQEPRNGQLLEAGKGKEMDLLQNLQKECISADPFSYLQNFK